MIMPLVLLPGLMCDARLFAPQVEALSANWPVTVADMSGHDRVEALAAGILADAPPMFALGGLSMGGIVAMEVLRQAPDRVAKLALMDTNPLAEAPEMQVRRGPQLEKALAGQLEQVMREEMKPNYLTEGPQRAAILDLCMDMAMDLGADVFVRQSMALRGRPDQRDTLRGVCVPTLVLCGRDDRLCPVARHELMHELVVSSVLEIIEGAGHLPTLEQPQQTTAALLRWMEDA
ncbi:alpha/beta hydrolase [uncultured Sulfitobacter sp.]|uniref:alpha/beta fold hydrolase n=1 Tax=uncultured Sulfitobacter sp. TaxID=191468 RepID=UPI00261CD8C6|nr:alpha/beta hydrolase [uncultured Sulfitobacter sp.]